MTPEANAASGAAVPNATKEDAVDGATMAVELGLLNGFELRRGARRMYLSLGSARVMAFVAIADRPLMRNYVAFSLWPDKGEQRALGNLRSALWRIRQLGLGLIECCGQRLRLGGDVVVDLHVATSVAQDVLCGRRPQDGGAVHRLLALGELLRDWYDPWISPERERLRQLRLHALDALSAQALDASDVTGAIDAGLAAVSAEPLRESAHRVLIRAHIAEGNLAEALRQYESYRHLASTELGILPSRRLEELVQPLRSIPVRATR